MMDKQIAPPDGKAICELLYGDVKDTPKVANPIFNSNSLSFDACNMAALLRTMQSGMDAYGAVYDGLIAFHGQSFKNNYLNEVHYG